jgi:signal transduction histidine kinase
MAARYRKQTNSVALTTFALGMLGLALLGALVGLFFRRLSDDLRRLQDSALQIVGGNRESPLLVTRHDEVGHLMGAVNDMADALDSRARELMVERQKYFHQEKMAAIGALAAGIAHEIGNPIAAISGIAQEMTERRDSVEKSCGSGNCHACHPEIISVQARRLATITREITEFASHRELEPQWVDLNAQLRSAGNLIRYDKRLKKVGLVMALDDQLPAIYGVADQLTQLIMNLIINAIDAMEDLPANTPLIRVTTAQAGERVHLCIEDNGCGIAPEMQERVFEAFFTTKAVGKGTGLGLSLCYAITQRHGASIELDSAPGQGTRVNVHFPLNDSAYQQAVQA